MLLIICLITTGLWKERRNAKNNQSIGDIKNSSVHGVNVNGKDIYLECPFDKTVWKLL